MNLLQLQAYFSTAAGGNALQCQQLEQNSFPKASCCSQIWCNLKIVMSGLG